MRKRMRILGVGMLCLLLPILLLAGCGKENHERARMQNVSGVISGIFTAPNEELSALLNSPIFIDGKSDDLESEYDAKEKELFGKYFTEEGYQSFHFQFYTASYQRICTDYGMELSVYSLSMEPRKDDPLKYDLDIICEYGFPGGEKARSATEGFVVFDEEEPEKIDVFHIDQTILYDMNKAAGTVKYR